MDRPFSLDGGGEQLPKGATDSPTNSDPYGAVPLGDGGASGGSGGSDRDGDDSIFDPERHIGRDRINTDGTYRRKRKRRGSAGINSSTKRSTKADLSASVDALTSTLIIVHAGLASLTKTPEWELSRDEGDALAKSLVSVLEQFDVTPDPKVQAIVGLVMTGGMIYGPKMYLYNERMKQRKAKPSVVSIDGRNFEEPLS